jgi:putative sigma-54 modulation protein
MEVKVQSVNFSADKKLIEFVNGKVGKLNTFIDSIVSSEVFLRVDQTSEKENKIAEVKISIPGKELFAKKQCKSFEEATDLAVMALKKQVEKHKS